MTLLSMPMELFEAILHYAIVVRGLARGLRLRLVNTTFARAVMQVLYNFRLLDNLSEKPRPIQSSKIFVSYLAYRTVHEPLNGNPFLLCFRRVANKIYSKQDISNPEFSTAEACVDKLCLLYLSSCRKPILSRFRDAFQWKSAISEVEYEKHLFAAALCTNNLSIVRDSITKNKQLIELDALLKDNLMFGAYHELPAKHSGQEMLEYLLAVVEPSLLYGLRCSFLRNAARASRLDIVRFLYDFKKEEVPWNFKGLYSAQYTPSLEVLTFIEQQLRLYPNPQSLELNHSRTFDLCTRTGNVDTAAHLIRLGVHIVGSFYMSSNYFDRAILEASRRDYAALVELLLENGADPKIALASAVKLGRIEIVQRLLNTGVNPVNVLLDAVTAGSPELVQLLLDAGADPNENLGSISPLAGAIAREHTVMFRLLLKRGADLHSKGTAEECVQIAKKSGLESMLLLLQEYGISIIG